MKYLNAYHLVLLFMKLKKKTKPCFEEIIFPFELTKIRNECFSLLTINHLKVKKEENYLY
jgi:hypothetical protein